MKTPIPHSYWVVPGRFLAGEYPRNKEDAGSKEKLKLLLDAGVSCFIDLTTEADGMKPYELLLGSGRLHRLSFPIRDRSIPKSKQVMTAILDQIDRELSRGELAYVHCWGGVGRTGTVVGCWLARHHGAETALQRLEELWSFCEKSAKREAPENEEQREYIRAWKVGPLQTTNLDSRLSRAEGCLLGQLAGDALGSLVEFQSPAQIRAKYPDGVRDMADGGTFNTLAGQPTDDSEMALLLARKLVERGTYDVEAARKAYQYWLQSGPFDCGNTISAALRGHPNAESQANGAMMRISPLGIFGARFEAAQVEAWARQDAAITHPHPVCLQSTALYARAIARAVAEPVTPQALYGQMLEWAAAMNADTDLMQVMHKAATERPEDYTRQQGWVLIAFQNALWQLLHAPSLEEAVVDTIMQGGDTDTNAAICGALLGAVHGRAVVPERWVATLLACRPGADCSRAKKPRPECFWPVDALDLAAALCPHGGRAEGERLGRARL